MPLYEMRIRACCTVAITADSEEEVIETASESVNYGDFQMDGVCFTRQVPDDEKDSLLRYADLVL